MPLVLLAGGRHDGGGLQNTAINPGRLARFADRMAPPPSPGIGCRVKLPSCRTT